VLQGLGGRLPEEVTQAVTPPAAQPAAVSAAEGEPGEMPPGVKSPWE